MWSRHRGDRQRRHYVKGTAVTITDPYGPATGSLTARGEVYHLDAAQRSNETVAELTITVGKNGDSFAATGRLLIEAGAPINPCVVSFTGHRISTSASVPPSTSQTVLPPRTTAPTTTSGTPVCSHDELQAALDAGSVPGRRLVLSPGGFVCRGDWAVVSPTDSNGDETSVLLHATAGVWHVDRTPGDCNSTLPAPIYPNCFAS